MLRFGVKWFLRLECMIESLDTPLQIKITMQKFAESLLTKSTKLRVLLRDLEKNYKGDQAASYLGLIYCQLQRSAALHPRTIQKLSEIVKTISTHYEQCNEVLAKGAAHGYGDELFACMFQSSVHHTKTC